MLSPKRTKFRKQMKGRMRGLSKGGLELAFGDYGLQALECGWLTSREIEAGCIAMTRHIKRGGKVCHPRVPGQAHHQEAGRDPNGQKARAVMRAGSQW